MTDARTPAIATASADEIARALDLPRPTAQQRAVIEAPLVPTLVVAGAGSGKTETMASRVLWLVANRLVARHEVLGLTFTRKAAGELGRRLADRLTGLAAAGLVDEDDDPFDAPVVSTYNAFAASVFRDHAALIGRDSDAVVLGEAAAWWLMRSLVVEHPGARLSASASSLDTIVERALRLWRAIRDNVADPARVAQLGRDVGALVELPLGGRGEHADWVKRLDEVGMLPELVDLGIRFDALKAERGLVEFSDQIADALAIVRRAPGVAAEIRARHRVVLLDEFQDTSPVQAELLAALFAHSAVTAVGDPNQAIYGWRGASASGLARFTESFGGVGGGEPADGSADEGVEEGDGGGSGASDRRVVRFDLSTSWRNGTGILDAAETIVAPLVGTAGLPVERLEPGPGASGHAVDGAWLTTIDEEAAQVAGWLADRLAEPAVAGRPPSAALLLRTRATQSVFLAALARAGVPFHVLGIGGLTAEPEIADLVAALQVVVDPESGPALVRLLAGSRWRLGVRDLGRLGEVARWLSRRDVSRRALPPEVAARFRASAAEGENGSIIDALDVLAHAPEGHPVRQGFSPVGLERLTEAGRLFASLRVRRSAEPAETVALVRQALLLDVEAIANPFLASDAARDAFDEALSSYLGQDADASLSGFVRWLVEAEERERLSPRPEDPEPGRVQVLTVHGAKGLEWDHVAVPRLVTGEFPSRPSSAAGWFSLGELPFELRGDRLDLPVAPWRSATTRKELVAAIGERSAFRAELAERDLREERRLAYVAVTRARHRLLLTGSWWSSQVAARTPSPFLVELADAGLVAPVPLDAPDGPNPRADAADRTEWPSDPLGARRDAVESAARAVRRRLGSTPPRDADADADGSGSAAERETGMLLTERAERRAPAPITAPPRIAASRFAEWLDDPEGLAQRTARPMPERPYRATRLGTLFHEWVERRSGLVGGGEALDTLPLERDDERPVTHHRPSPPLGGSAPLEDAERTGADEGDVGTPAGGAGRSGRDAASDTASDAVEPDVLTEDAGALARLIATFERSRWAAARPLEVETEIQLPFDGRVVVCRIDAVYAEGDRIRIVDWKTGRAPADRDELARRSLQLALYRLAYSRFRGIPIGRIDASFYFVADDVVVDAVDVADEDELLSLWRAGVTGA